MTVVLKFWKIEDIPSLKIEASPYELSVSCTEIQVYLGISGNSVNMIFVKPTSANDVEGWIVEVDYVCTSAETYFSSDLGAQSKARYFISMYRIINDILGYFWVLVKVLSFYYLPYMYICKISEKWQVIENLILFWKNNSTFQFSKI